MTQTALTYSPDQAEAHDRIAAALRGVGVDIDTVMLTPPREGKRVVLAVTGKAGSGKTLLLAALYRALEEAGVETPLNSVSMEQEWRTVPMNRRRGKASESDMADSYTMKVGLDSGAAVSVLPRNSCPECTLNSNEGYTAYYKAANGEVIADDGSKCVTCITQDSQYRHINFRVTGVHKALASVSAICDRNQKVVFDNDGCYIEDKHSGQRTPFQRENDVYHLDVRIPRNSQAKNSRPLAPLEKCRPPTATKSVFTRLAETLP